MICKKRINKKPNTIKMVTTKIKIKLKTKRKVERECDRRMKRYIDRKTKAKLKATNGEFKTKIMKNMKIKIKMMSEAKTKKNTKLYLC